MTFGIKNETYILRPLFVYFLILYIFTVCFELTFAVLLTNL